MNNFKNNWTRLLCLRAVLATTTVIACVTASSVRSEPLNLGVISSLDGPAAFVGLAAQAGLKVAEETINKDPERFLGDKSRSLVLDGRSGGSTVTQALALAREFASDPKYLAILGPSVTGQALAVGPFAQQSGISNIHMHSPAAGLTTPGKYVFAVAQPAKSIAEAAVKAYLEKYPKTRKVGVITVTDNQAIIATTDAAISTFKAGGVEVVPFGISFASLDFSNAVDTLKQANVEAIYLGQSGPAITAAVQQAQRAGLNVKYLGYATMASQTVLNNVGPLLAQSIISADYNPRLDTALNKAFVEDYKKITGNEPDTYGAQAFTSGLLVANAIKSIKGEVTREKLADALAATKNVEAVVGVGTFTFDTDRVVAPPPALLTIVGNQIAPYKP